MGRAMMKSGAIGRTGRIHKGGGGRPTQTTLNKIWKGKEKDMRDRREPKSIPTCLIQPTKENHGSSGYGSRILIGSWKDNWIYYSL